MLHQRIQADQVEPFPGDADANRAVIAVGSRVAEYAEMSRRLAIGQFATHEAREAFRKAVLEKREIIISRARSGGIVEHELERFWEAAIAHAAQQTGRRVEIYPIPPRREPAPTLEPAAPKAKRVRPRKIRGGRA